MQVFGVASPVHADAQELPMLIAIGIAFMAVGITTVWYLTHHPRGTPFPLRYRDLIESYLAVVLAALLFFGASFIIVGLLLLF
jgi:hypothetical protein